MRKESLLLLGVLVLAALFRFWQLGSIPPGLYPDEAMNGNDALLALRNGDWKVFYPANNGREGLFINIQALFLQGFLGAGLAPWMLRLPSAIFGVLTVWAVYLVTRELFNSVIPSRAKRGEETQRSFAEFILSLVEGLRMTNEWIPLLAAFFTAISFWHVNFSRIGFRAITVPLIATLLVFALLRAWRLKSAGWAAFAGLLLGLGFYTYIAFRVVPLLVGIIFLSELFVILRSRSGRRISRDSSPPQVLLRKIWAGQNDNGDVGITWSMVNGQWSMVIKKWLVFAAVFALTVLPITGYFLAHPADFLGRAGDVSVFQSENPVRALGQSLAKTAGMFQFSGDWNWRHNIAGSPQLFWPIGIFFLIGLAYSIRNMGNGLRQAQAVNHYSPSKPRPEGSGRVEGSYLKEGPSTSSGSNKSMVNGQWSIVIVMMWLLAGLLPTLLSTEGIPHALRAIGAIPPTMIVSAMGAVWLFDALRKKINYQLLFTVYFLLFTLLAVAEFYRYFFVWAPNQHVAGAFRTDLVGIADFLNQYAEVGLPREVRPQRYVIVNEDGVMVDLRPYLGQAASGAVPMPAQTLIFLTEQDPAIRYLTRAELDQIEPPAEGQSALVVPLKFDDEDLVNSLRAAFPAMEAKEEAGVRFWQL